MLRLLAAPVVALLVALGIVGWAVNLRSETAMRRLELDSLRATVAGQERQLKLLSTLPRLPLRPRMETGRVVDRSLLDAADLLGIKLRLDPASIEWKPLSYGVWEGRVSLIAETTSDAFALTLGTIDVLLKDQPAVISAAAFRTSGSALNVQAEIAMFGR